MSTMMTLDGTNASRIRIPRQNYYPSNNTQMTISGWGATGVSKSIFNILFVSIHNSCKCDAIALCIISHLLIGTGQIGRYANKS